MELSYIECDQILKTLPIGFYAGRRIEASLEKEAIVSKYSPIEDKIMISYQQIAANVKKIPDSENKEEAVRSSLYHEVSHAILTPQGILNEYNPEKFNEFEIVEDERIESMLANYYHGVDFKKQLYNQYGGVPPQAKNVDQAFFNAVRFGLGSEAVKDKLKHILQDYQDMNRLDEHDDRFNYKAEINVLYSLVKRDFERDKTSFNNPPPTQQQEENKTSASNPSKENQDNDSKDAFNGCTPFPESKGSAEEKKSEESFTSNEYAINPDDFKKMAVASLNKDADCSDRSKRQLADFKKRAEMIIANFNKRNAGGSGIQSYSGVLNPRATTRQDYRFFDRPITINGNNRYGTCHLNMVIDISGSFRPNEQLTNGILRALTEIERKNCNFSMDVIFINEEMRKCKTFADRQFEACNGNKIPPQLKQELQDLQLPNTCNYNIILFDGDALSDDRVRYDEVSAAKRFSMFDMKQTTLITDDDNLEYMPHGFSAAKVIVTKHYTDELMENIIHALNIAFS